MTEDKEPRPYHLVIHLTEKEYELVEDFSHDHFTVEFKVEPDNGVGEVFKTILMGVVFNVRDKAQ